MPYFGRHLLLCLEILHRCCGCFCTFMMSVPALAFNVLGYYSSWFALILSAAHSVSYLGVIYATIFLGLHFFMSKHKKRDLFIGAFVTCMGSCIDGIFTYFGVFVFSDTYLFLPFWLMVIWVCFSQILVYGLHWLNRRYVLSSILGAIFAPLSYYSGFAFEAVYFPSVPQALLFIGGVWAMILPLFMAIINKSAFPLESKEKDPF